MEIPNSRYAFAFHIVFRLRTPLLLLTGDGDEILDDTIDKTPDGKKLHINGYVWASLLRRSLMRIKKGEHLAQQIGKYGPRQGVSPLWCEASFVDLTGLDSRPGIMIDRKWGAATTGALYNEETVPPGIQIPLQFTWFVPEDETDQDTFLRMLMDSISSALWLINDGIENIGGGWSYGYGRLLFESGQVMVLDLSRSEDRKRLFAPVSDGQPLALPKSSPKKSLPWKKISLQFKITDGQLLAVHTRAPLLDADFLGDELPDTFVFRSYVFDHQQNRIIPAFVIPGKAIRQGLFSLEIERRLRTRKETICFGTEQGRQSGALSCQCKRCKWFGSTSKSGIIAVLDALVELPDSKNALPSTVIHRIQLCEHSGQNINLFAEEYLTEARFTTDVIIDQSRQNSEHGELMEYIDAILSEMKSGGAPPGWYRIGATATCTGQIELSEGPSGPAKEVAYGN